MEQSVTMYGTQIGLVSKGTRAKPNANPSHLFKNRGGGRRESNTV